MSRLAGKTALITGGGQGVGFGIARTFALEGAAVMITGRTAETLRSAAADLEGLSAGVATCLADTRARDDAWRAVCEVVDRFGGLDVLLNNAQSSKPGTPLEDIDEATLHLTVESGLYGTFHHMQAAFPHMMDKGGSIINLGSREGIFGGAGFGAYAAAKEGVRGLSRTAAREWGKHKIRVNLICPTALSPIAAKYLAEHPNEAEAYRKDIALGYFGDPNADIGPAALFLASDDSRYVTGQTINVDGGQTML